MHLQDSLFLGAPVVPFYPFSFWVPLLKPNSRKKGTLIIKGLLGNLGFQTLPHTLGSLACSEGFTALPRRDLDLSSLELQGLRVSGWIGWVMPPLCNLSGYTLDFLGYYYPL